MIILTGASASGKTEVARLLAKKYGIVKVVTTTSRAPREGEKDGIDYHFLTDEEFLKRVNENQFVEHVRYNGFFYGTGKSEISPSKCVVVDPKGLASFLSLHDKSIVSFFLEADEETREQRMIGRKDKPEDIAKRLSNDRIAFDPRVIPQTDFLIKTDDKTIEEITDWVYLRYALLTK